MGPRKRDCTAHSKATKPYSTIPPARGDGGWVGKGGLRGGGVGWWGGVGGRFWGEGFSAGTAAGGGGGSLGAGGVWVLRWYGGRWGGGGVFWNRGVFGVCGFCVFSSSPPPQPRHTHAKTGPRPILKLQSARNWKQPQRRSCQGGKQHAPNTASPCRDCPPACTVPTARQSLLDQECHPTIQPRANPSARVMQHLVKDHTPCRLRRENSSLATTTLGQALTDDDRQPWRRSNVHLRQHHGAAQEEPPGTAKRDRPAQSRAHDRPHRPPYPAEEAATTGRSSLLCSSLCVSHTGNFGWQLTTPASTWGASPDTSGWHVQGELPGRPWPRSPHQVSCTPHHPDAGLRPFARPIPHGPKILSGVGQLRQATGRITLRARFWQHPTLQQRCPPLGAGGTPGATPPPRAARLLNDRWESGSSFRDARQANWATLSRMSKNHHGLVLTYRSTCLRPDLLLFAWPFSLMSARFAPSHECPRSCGMSGGQKSPCESVPPFSTSPRYLVRTEPGWPWTAEGGPRSAPSLDNMSSPLPTSPPMHIGLDLCLARTKTGMQALRILLPNTGRPPRHTKRCPLSDWRFSDQPPSSHWP